jgi:hypothetical protein
MSKLYTNTVVVFLLLLTSVLQWSCNVINPAEKVPTYIHIDSFSFESSDLHDIRYAWVYYNNNPVGAFDLPANVPIMTSGDGTLQITPGISINGRAERPLGYPFYKIYSTTLKEQPGKIQTILPTTGYYDSVKFTVISEFEGGITKFSKTTGTTSINTTSADSLKLEGSGSGIVILSSAADSSEDSTRTFFNVPTGAAFIEFDYKTSVNFTVGINGMLGSSVVTPVNYLAGILPNSKWQKFYLNITSFVSTYPGGNYYLYIKTTLPAGQSSGRLLIDNIKLVTF